VSAAARRGRRWAGGAGRDEASGGLGSTPAVPAPVVSSQGRTPILAGFTFMRRSQRPGATSTARKPESQEGRPGSCGVHVLPGLTAFRRDQHRTNARVARTRGATGTRASSVFGALGVAVTAPFTTVVAPPVRAEALDALDQVDVNHRRARLGPNPERWPASIGPTNPTQEPDLRACGARDGCAKGDCYWRNAARDASAAARTKSASMRFHHHSLPSGWCPFRTDRR
jgi:hypothetical protein